MITISRFPHARFLMGPSGSRIVSVRNNRTGIETVYPARKSHRRLIVSAMGIAGALVVVALVGVIRG